MVCLKRVGLTVVTLVVCGCAGGPPSRMTFDSAAVADTLRRITMSFPNALRTLNADTVVLAFGEDLVWIADAHLFPNRDSVKADAARRYAAMKSINFRWDTLRVAVLGPEAGVVTGIARASIVDAAGKPLGVRAGATYVFARRAGQWKVIHGHASHAVMSQ